MVDPCRRPHLAAGTLTMTPYLGLRASGARTDGEELDVRPSVSAALFGLVLTSCAQAGARYRR